MQRHPNKKPKTIHIGTSGWTYNHWKENFYPENLKQKEWLAYYSNTFSTVEINTTFYHLPLISTVENWFNQVNENFLFSIKASRYITHQKRLHDCQENTAIFMKRIESLKNKLGPILIQLPPSFKMSKERLMEFIDSLDKAYRYTFEFRHPSWFVDDIYDILKIHNLALCITDLNGVQSPEEITADFTYIRLHGPHVAYQGSYGDQKLKHWQKKIVKWWADASVFCYFDNDEKGYAIQDAISLKEKLDC